MIFAYLALVLLCFLKNENIKGFGTQTYLARDTTDSVKGLFIMLVFLSHLKSYITYTARIDIMGGKISSLLGQLIVTMFLFYSGYGVCEAIKKKGWEYIRQFPKNRVLKTLLHFDLAVLMFVVMNLVLGKEQSVKDILLSLVCWKSIGNSNWYIFAVIALYIITWVSFMIFRKKKLLGAVAVTALVFGYIFVIKRYQETWWYDTVLCYPLGIWFSLGKDRIEKLLTKNNFLYFLCLGIVGGATLLLYLKKGSLPASIAYKTLFSLVFVIASLKFAISNDILKWLGAHTFEIFILQRIPMIVFNHLGLNDFNLYLYVALSFAVTLLLTVVFRKLTDSLDKVFFKKPKPKALSA